MVQSNSYASSPLSLFRLQEQFRQHMAATNNLVHYPSFDMSTPSSLPYLGMNVNMSSPLGSLPCQTYYQTLSQAQQVWNSPLLQATQGSLPGSLNSKTTSIENLRLRAKQHAASLGLDTLPNWSSNYSLSVPTLSSRTYLWIMGQLWVNRRWLKPSTPLLFSWPFATVNNWVYPPKTLRISKKLLR